MPCPKVSIGAPSSEIDLSLDGKHHGYVRVPYSSHRSAYGWLPVPIMSIRNGDGPSALLVGGNHGDEYEGISIFIELFQALSPKDISGQLIFLPAANAPAVYAGRRTSPLDHGGEGNLNRLFPGHKNGTPTETIAWFITNHLIDEVDAIFDLHSAGSSSDHWPSCKIRLMGDAAKDAMQMKFLELFGAPIALVGDRVHETTLSGEALPKDIIYVSTELGGAGRITPWIREMGDQGLKRCLKHMGILPESYPTAEPKFTPRTKAMQREENYIYAYADGMFEPAVEVGDEVEDGQFAGYIWNIRQPWGRAHQASLQEGRHRLLQASPRALPDRRHALLHVERLRGLGGGGVSFARLGPTDDLSSPVNPPRGCTLQRRSLQSSAWNRLLPKTQSPPAVIASDGAAVQNASASQLVLDCRVANAPRNDLTRPGANGGSSLLVETPIVRCRYPTQAKAATSNGRHRERQRGDPECIGVSAGPGLPRR